MFQYPDPCCVALGKSNGYRGATHLERPISITQESGIWEQHMPRFPRMSRARLVQVDRGGYAAQRVEREFRAIPRRCS